METFNLRKISELQFSKQYHIKISNRFASLENLNDNEDRIVERRGVHARDKLLYTIPILRVMLD